MTKHGLNLKCSVEDCDKPHSSKGFCHFHYNRWHRYGDPLTAKKPNNVRKLSVQQVQAIHRDYQAGQSRRRLAQTFGISTRQVDHILAGRCWPQVWQEMNAA